jgi:protocatechuate 3,4-dioxygenase beta subunit
MLSKNLLQTLSSEELREVLVHECAHVLRRDAAIGLLQRIALVLFWPYPLVLLLNRHLTIAREEVCDNYVLLHSTGPQYAQTLFDLSERIHPLSPNLAPVGLFQHHCPLEKRVAGLLDLRRNVMTKINRWAALSMAIVFLTITLAAAGARVLKAEPKAATPDEKPAADKVADPTKKEVAKDDSAKQDPTKQETVVRGQVVDRNGRALAGVEVSIVGHRREPRASTASWSETEHTLLGGAKTDADGRFHVSLPRLSSAAYYEANAIVRADGYGTGHQPIGLDVESPELKVQLPEEQILQCRLVDADGKPAAKAKVRVTSIGKGKGPEDYVGLYFPDLSGPRPYWPAALVTDDEGRFTLRGIAADQQFGVTVRDDRFARDQLDVKPKDRSAGTTLTLTAPRAQILEGDVIYEDTRKPVANARLLVGASRDPSRCIMNMQAQTDTDGHFCVNGYSGTTFFVTAYPPEGEPYLVFKKEIEAKDGKLPEKIDVAVPSGILVRGRITDKGADKPVAGAGVQYQECNNRQKKDGVIVGWSATVLSNSNGEFQIAVPPGRGVLFVKGPGNDYLLQQTTMGEIEKGIASGRRQYANAIVPLDLKPDSRPDDVKVSLTRGATVKGKIVGPGDKPLDEALMVSRIFLGADETWARCEPVAIRGGQFELHGLDPEKSVPVYFLDPKDELGAVMEISGKSAEKQPLVVRLEPCGKAAGRFLGKDGKPLVNYVPDLSLVATPGVCPYGFVNARKAVAADQDFAANIDRMHYWHGPETDAEGRCTLPVLIPGATYRINIYHKSNEWDVKDFTVKPGETFQLSDTTLEMTQDDVKPREEETKTKKPADKLAEKAKEDQTANAALASIERRAVNKLVKDFPEKTDLSTPKSALAAYHRATAKKDTKAVLELGWRKYGQAEIDEMERFWKSDAPADMDVYLKAVLDAEVLEVLSYKGDLAVVISKLKFPEGVGRDPFSARVFGRINGQWKNLGEDRMPSVEAATTKFENNKDAFWKDFVDVKDELAGKKPAAKPGNEFKLPPDKYEAVKATTPDAERLLLMGLVENFFVNNARDITARKSLEWGEIKKNADGSRSIRYKFEARIWDKETRIADQIFTFDKDNVMLSYKDADGPPVKKEPKKIDLETKEGLMALVEDFFAHNFRDVTSRETLEWGDVEKDKDGNTLIRYKYVATIWGKDQQIMNQIFTFDKKGEFVRYENVEGFPQKMEKKGEKPQAAPPEHSAAATAEEIDGRWRWVFEGSDLHVSKYSIYSPNDTVPIKYAQASIDVARANYEISADANRLVRNSVSKAELLLMKLETDRLTLLKDYYEAVRKADEAAVVKIARRYAKSNADYWQCKLDIALDANERVPQSVPTEEIEKLRSRRELAENRFKKIREN